ncbi:superoxide dismutase [Mycotypha africana]|uniref:superoxide dismutase n=1 Tax=Mycotypha africana TaxID=64632 RepID=UPI0023010B3C|nr:superoxide dismutase [Mycotypha africana]KAI8991184.1 superoxide dismutase [Mycotypha africana]
MKFSLATAISSSVLLLASLLSTATAEPSGVDKDDMPEFPVKAIAMFRNNATVAGTVLFSQESINSPTEIFANITGLDANTEHGLHIHELGDLIEGCASLGAHYNPFNTTHGAPDAADDKHHAGDFGNVVADANGMAILNLKMKTVQLVGPHSVIGRGIVLHSGKDDLGLGDSPLSLTTGNSGDRLACGVIGRAASDA